MTDEQIRDLTLIPTVNDTDTLEIDDETNPIGYKTSIAQLKTIFGVGVTEQNIIWVGKHGNDSNDGKNIERAKLTFGAATTAAVSGDVIVCLDSGTYTEALTSKAGVNIYAPNATMYGDHLITHGNSYQFAILDGATTGLRWAVTAPVLVQLIIGKMVLNGSASGFLVGAGGSLNVTFQHATLQNGTLLTAASAGNTFMEFEQIDVSGTGAVLSALVATGYIYIRGSSISDAGNGTLVHSTADSSASIDAARINMNVLSNITAGSTVDIVAATLEGDLDEIGGGRVNHMSARNSSKLTTWVNGSTVLPILEHKFGEGTKASPSTIIPTSILGQWEVYGYRGDIPSPQYIQYGEITFKTAIADIRDGHLLMEVNNTPVTGVTVVKQVLDASSIGTLELMETGDSLNLAGLNWPTSDGTTGQVLTTDGATNLSFQDTSSPYWNRVGTDLEPKTAGDNVDLLTGGLKDNDVTTAVALGDSSNISFNSNNKNIIGNANSMLTITHSCGCVIGGLITDAGGGNIDVTLGSGFFRATDSDSGVLFELPWSALLGSAIPTDTTRYIGAIYNAGSPIITIKTSDTWNWHTEFPLGSVVNEGGTLYILNNPWRACDPISYATERFYETRRFERAGRLGGLILGETGTRNITLSGGELYDALNEFIISSVDTSVTGGFDTYTGTTKVATAATQWDNQNYDNAGVLTPLPTNWYANLWFYIEAGDNLVMVYGIDDYPVSASAENEGVPTIIPQRLQAHGKLVGRLLFQQGATTALLIDSAFEQDYESTTLSNHANLSNLDYSASNHGSGFTGFQRGTTLNSSIPTVNDDSSAGYVVGDLWVDTTTKLGYTVVDTTIGSAVWVKNTTEDHGVLTNLTYDTANHGNGYTGFQRGTTDTTVDPTVNNDATENRVAGDRWINTVTSKVYTLLDPSIGAAVWEEVLLTPDIDLQNVTARDEINNTVHSATAAPELIHNRARGTQASPVIIQQGDLLGEYKATGYRSDFTVPAQIEYGKVNFLAKSTDVDSGQVDLVINTVTAPGTVTPKTVLTATSDGNASLMESGDSVSLAGLNWPTADGSANDYLKTDGAGNLSFTALPTEVDGIQVYYVGKHGNDSSNGKSWDKAFLTIGAALTAAVAFQGTPTPANQVRIMGLDGGTYVESDFVVSAYIDLYMPYSRITANIEMEAEARLTVFEVTQDHQITNGDGTGRATVRIDRISHSTQPSIYHNTGAGFTSELDVYANILSSPGASVPAVRNNLTASILTLHYNEIQLNGNSAIGLLASTGIINAYGGRIFETAGYTTTTGLSASTGALINHYSNSNIDADTLLGGPGAIHHTNNGKSESHNGSIILENTGSSYLNITPTVQNVVSPTVNITGSTAVNINSIKYPVIDGIANQPLTTNGSGVLTFEDMGALDIVYQQNGGATSTALLVTLFGVPVVTEGAIFFSQTYVPHRGDSELIIETGLIISTNVSDNVILALFDGPTCLQSVVHYVLLNSFVKLSLTHRVAAGGVGSRTYAVRYGPVTSGTTAYINSNSSGQILGGTSNSFFILGESKTIYP